MFSKVYNSYCHCFECSGKWWQIKLQNSCRKVVIIHENRCEQTTTSFESEKKIGDVYIKKVWNEKYKRFLYYYRILYSIVSHSKATNSKINKLYQTPIHHKLRFTPKAYTLITNYNLEWSRILHTFTKTPWPGKKTLD
jgi:hypothetical protein